MSRFSALKGFMGKVYEASMPFTETSKEYFFKIIQKPEFEGLALQIDEAYHSSEIELDDNVESLKTNEERLRRYLVEAKALMHPSAEFSRLLQINSSLMLKALLESTEIGQGSVSERAYMQMLTLVNLHWANNPRYDPTFPSLPSSIKERIALYQIIGTGAFHAWEELNDEVDRQLRLVDTLILTGDNTAISVDENARATHKRKRSVPSPSEIKLAAGDFNLNLFLSTVSLKPSMLPVIDRALIKMSAIKQVSRDTYESIEDNGIGIPFMAVCRKLVDLREVQDITTSDGHLKLWEKFFQAKYGAYITLACSKYGSNVAKFCDALITAEIALKEASSASK